MIRVILVRMHGRRHGHGVRSHLRACPGSGRQRRAPGVRPAVVIMMVVVVVLVAGWAHRHRICMNMSFSGSRAGLLVTMTLEEHQGRGRKH